MSNRAEREAEDRYERDNDPSPVQGNVVDDTYAHTTNPALSYQVPVQKDRDDYEDPIQPPFSNTNKQLEQDEQEAMNEGEIISGDRLRHAKPQTANKYSEGPDENNLPI